MHLLQIYYFFSAIESILLIKHLKHLVKHSKMTMLRYIYYNFVTSVLVLLHTGRADDLSSIGHFHIYMQLI